MVPENMVTTLLKGIHGDILYGNEGQFKTKERVLQSYWWKDMDQDINKFLAKCDKCQKIQARDKKMRSFHYPKCSEPNQRIHMDLFGPLKISESGKKVHNVSP
jgi:hypothetical protein